MAFRDGSFESLKVPLAWTAALGVALAAAFAVLLLIGDRRESMGVDGYAPPRQAFDQAAAPANGLFAAPVRWFGHFADWLDDYFFAVSENRRLKEQVAELQAWRDAAIALKNVNARYEAMLDIRTEPPIPMVTGRAVSEARGPFANARLIDVGEKKGVRIGNPVVNEHGLVGRVVGTSGGVSRVLLVTDVASRTPVLVNRTDARAIMVGDGGGVPKLEFVRGRDSIRTGDQILTSGDGGVLPRGLPVGVAARGLDGTWRVKLYSERGAIDYVRVLLFEDFAQLTDRERLNPQPLSALDSAPPPSPELAAEIETEESIRSARAQADREAAARLEAARRAQAAQSPPPPAAKAAAAAPPPAKKTTASPPPPAAKAPPVVRQPDPEPEPTQDEPEPAEPPAPGGRP